VTEPDEDGRVEVRTTMQPDTPLRVEPYEARDLQVQGLLVSDEPEPEPEPESTEV
jgi:hypothetical protein